MCVACSSNGFLMAKPEVTIYGQTFPRKGKDEKIDVYQTKTPDKDYLEIAKITCGDTEDSWNMKQILIKAREVGADAIIIIGESGSYGIGDSSFSVVKGYGMTAVAIKYKEI